MNAAARAAARTLATAAALLLASAAAQGGAPNHDAANGARPLGADLPEPALAAPSEVRAFLDAVLDHPGLRAARAGRVAAERELDGVRSPFALDASVAFTRIDARRPEDPLPPPLDDLQSPPDGWSHQAQVDLRLRPFLAGDLADAEAQLVISALRAERTERETRAALEAAALQASAGVQLAERGLTLSDAGAALAEHALDSTRTRHALGAASDAELRRAEASLVRALEGRRSAVARLREAERSLRDLVGEATPLPGLPDLAPIDAPDPAVLQAEEDLRLTEVGARNAERSLLPVAQASYSMNVGDDALSISIESRTFQPTVSYQTPGGLGGGGGGGAGGLGGFLPDSALPRVDGAFTVGASVSLGPEGFHALETARARMAAAEAGVQAARADADRARFARADALRAARAELELARLDVELAEADARDTDRRVDAGLAVPLEATERALAVAEARLALDSARLDLLGAVLRGYRELAVPPSEALP